MNRYMLKAQLHGLPSVDVDAIPHAAEVRGVDVGDDHVAALTLAALFPEHVRSAPSLTPAERLHVFDRMARVDAARAAAFRDENPAAMKIADTARERERAAVDAKRREVEGSAWSAERRLGEVREALRLETLRIRDLEAQRGGPFDVKAALDAAISRGVALTREVQALEATATAAREAAAKLTAERP